MSGAGNDFIIIDHRRPFLAEEEMADFAKMVCRRKFSVGADGLIFIENSTKADFRWQFFNGDGSRAEMCGNGARCAARFAYIKGISPARMRFLTMAGVIEAEITNQAVRIRMTPPVDLLLNREIEIDGELQLIHTVNTGVPHALLLLADLAEAPVKKWGGFVRYHKLFQPAGTNVNFVQCVNDNELRIRTYERGVEEETMACGTGAVAAAIIGGILQKVRPPVKIITSGGGELIIDFKLTGHSESMISDLFLEGAADFIYEGQLVVS